MAYNNRKAWYVDSVNYAAVTAWAATTAKTVGQMVRQVSPSVGNERVFICAVAGTTAGSEPTWVLTNGARSPAAGNDGSVLWYECTGAAGVNGDATNVSAWTDAQIKGVAQTVGQVIRNVGNGTASYFICTTAGTPSATTEPTWNTTTGATTTDGSATWTCLGPQSGFSPFGAPDARLETSYAKAALSSGAGAGNVVYIASSHTQTVAGALVLTANGTGPLPSALICVGKTHAPPTSADETTGARVANTGNNIMTLGSFAGGLHYNQGVTYSCGDSTASANMVISSQSMNYKNCSLILGGSGAQNFTTGQARQACVLDNTTLTFGGTGQSIQVSGLLRWRNTASALLGTLPTTNLVTYVINGLGLICEGVDLSALANTSPIVGAVSANGMVILKDCKLASGQQIMAAGAPSDLGGVECTLIRADSGATNYRTEKYSYTGTLFTETVVVRTGGASDGTTAQSWKIVGTANASWQGPFEALPIVEWNAVTATNRNVTIHGIADPRFFSALPNNDEVWIDVEYAGDASTPMGSWQTGTKATFLTANAALSASIQAWDSLATARANSTAYVAGNIYKAASNSGRLFFCTTAGTTAASEPGGIATAVDGGAVTDGTAVFTAGWRFRQVVTLSSPQPQMVGLITAYPKVAKPSAIVYIDPLISLS